MNRRAALGALAAVALAPDQAHAFGQAGAFHARMLSTGGKRWGGERETSPGRWSWELARRTSAPARLVVTQVAADAARLLSEPFVVWAGAGEVPELSAGEIRGLGRFLELGGVMLVDDSDPNDGAFGRAARRELKRVLPERPVVRLDPSHVLFKTYYLLDRPFGRVDGPDHIEAIVRAGSAQVIFSSHDLLGALARSPGGSWALPVEPGGARQRELALRLAVNVGMYVLCSDYKDDQVHAPWLMRRRAPRR